MKKLSILVLSLLFITLSYKQSLAQPLVLGTAVEEWSPDQNIDLGNGVTLKIRNRIMKHFGTTCIYEFYVLNTSANKAANYWMGFNKNGQIYETTAIKLSLKPNYETKFKMEFRECLKRRVKDPIISCGACGPSLGFIEIK